MKRTLVLAAICFCLTFSIASAADVKIGLMAPLTGSWASEGQEMKQVLELLLEEVNAKGGLLGGKVELFSEDDEGDPRTAEQAAQRLAARGIVAVIGTYGSSITEASQNIYNQSSIIQIANGSTAVRLSEKGLKFFFRTCPRDDEQGRVAAQTIRRMKVKNVAILHDNTTYAKGLAEEAKGLLGEMKIVFHEALTPGEQDYRVILAKLRSAKPEVVFFTGYYPEAGLLLRQKKDMKWNVPFIGGDATNNPDLVKIAGADAAKGYCFLSAPLPKDLPSKQARSFLAAFEKRYGRAPSSIYSVLAGDGFQTVAAAVRETKSADAAKIAEFLHKSYKEPNALTGTITFNGKGDRVGEVYRVYKVDEKGSFILQP
jgi:branched-chain amino acid transport system substrate-binding protein